MPAIIDPGKCIRCGTCANICVTDCFAPYEKGELPVVRYPEECWHCRSCVMDCPAGAISLYYPLPISILYKDAPKRDESSEGGAQV